MITRGSYVHKPMVKFYRPPPPPKNNITKYIFLQLYQIIDASRQNNSHGLFRKLRKTFFSGGGGVLPKLYFSLKALVKGEVRSWSNLISEERVKFSEQNSENLIKIGWQIRKLWHFQVSQIFRKHFLTSPYEYANEWVDDVIASLLAIYFVHNILKIWIFCPNFW